MRRAILVAIGISILAIVALPVAAVWYLYSTESGLRFIVARLPHRMGRAEVTIENASGTLRDGVRIEHFLLLHERVRIDARNLEGRLRFLPIWLQTLSVDDASIGKLGIDVYPRSSPPSDWTPRFLPPFLRIDVNGARVGAARLTTTTGRSYDVSGLSAAGAVRHRDIRIHDAAMDYQNAHVTAVGELHAAQPLELAGDLRILFHLDGQPDWVSNASIGGNLDRIDIDATLAEPFRSTFHGAAHDLTQGWHWDGRALVHDFSLTPWQIAGPLGVVTGELQLDGDADGIRAAGPLTPHGLDAGPFSVTFNGNYAAGVVNAERITVRHQGSRAYAEASGTIGIESNGPRLDLTGAWSDFRWPLPLTEERGFASRAGQFSLHGIWPYALQSNGELESDLAASSPFEMSGELDRGELRIRSGTLAVLDGKASLRGELVWDAPERWQLQGRAEGINPASLRQALTGSASFNYAVSGDALGGDSNLDLRIGELGGTLRGKRLSGGGRLLRQRDVWSFEKVRMAAGSTRVELDGSLGAHGKLRFGLETEDLALLADGSRGHLKANGTIDGNPQALVWNFAASGNGIRHEGIAVDKFTATVAIDSRSGANQSADIDVTNLAFRDRVIERLAITVSGPADAHRIELAARATNAHALALAQGRFAAGSDRWSGTVSAFSIDNDEDLHLVQDGPGEWLIAPERKSLDGLCLKGESARLCVTAESRPDGWSAEVSARDLPMSALTAGQRKRVSYDGTVNVVARGFGASGALARGTLRSELNGAKLMHRRANGRVDTTTLGSGELDIDLDADGLHGKVDLDAEQVGEINGSFTAARQGSQLSGWPLRGDLILRTRELGFVSAYVPEVDRVRGQLDAELVVGGTLGAPSVNGVLKLANGAIDLYQINLSLHDAALEARLIDNRLSFSGKLKAGDGSLETSGDLLWSGGIPKGNLQLRGNDLLLVDVPEARIIASPNLDFAVDGRSIDVKGEVLVPRARIAPADLTGAVLPSSDERIVSESKTSADDGIAVATAIRLKLGDDVSVDTYGLSGRITGSIDLRSQSDGVTRANGELSVIEGKYVALGRRLDIERGRLLFTGGLLADPGVEIRAVKRFPDAVAGVNVRGRLAQPRMTFFSEPSLPQSQVVSLLLAGGSIESAQDSTSANATRSQLLAQGGAIIAQQFGSKLGIEDVAIEQNLANETALVLGKYLSPRLYVSYGISLTQALNTIKMRYTLGDRWTLRSEAGEERSAELVYTIEK
ncbi:MAG: translocation/assembly module TamB domain-containing protein [Steroidobacteraceae bacterium]